MGLIDKSSGAIAVAMKQFASNFGLVDTFGYLDIDMGKLDAGSQFTLVVFLHQC